MEAISALIHGDLPPAGNRISLKPSSLEQFPTFPDYQSVWVDSGTSALALALLSTRQKHPHISEPEVIVPAYCCPDLVAAAHFAGLKVVIADIANADPALDADSLLKAISAQTIAVIAVNFLGIREKLAALRQLLVAYPHISVIEDNAQWFPQPEAFSSLSGDYVIFSFGRGKPLSLLGGGLLLIKGHQPLPYDHIKHHAPASHIQKLKLLAYNTLLMPRFYQLLNRNPLIKLGETRYHPLESITSMSQLQRSLLPENFQRYCARKLTAESYYDDLFSRSSLNHMMPLTSSRRMRLLRYPVVLDEPGRRDTLLKRLHRAGLGASAMYQKPLAEIDGMQAMICHRGNYTNAADFAARLITLPVHDGVTSHHLERIARIINSC